MKNKLTITLSLFNVICFIILILPVPSHTDDAIGNKLSNIGNNYANNIHDFAGTGNPTALIVYAIASFAMGFIANYIKKKYENSQMTPQISKNTTTENYNMHLLRPNYGPPTEGTKYTDKIETVDLSLEVGGTM